MNFSFEIISRYLKCIFKIYHFSLITIVYMIKKYYCFMLLKKIMKIRIKK